MTALESWLHEQNRAGRDLYLMLDIDGQMDTRAALLDEQGVARYRNLYAGTAANALAQAGPLLFHIDSIHDPAIQSLLRAPERNWGWLASASHVELDTLAAHWRERVL
ncbi:DUF4123 domain-containing protein, partial [Pseudomonas sp. HMWF006]